MSLLTYPTQSILTETPHTDGLTPQGTQAVQPPLTHPDEFPLRRSIIGKYIARRYYE